MTRQRLTIEADAVYVEAHDYWHLTGPGGQRQTFIPGWAVTDAEPLPEPLPTEPGESFWGRSDAIPREQRWFVQGAPGWHKGADASYIVYVPALDGVAYNSSCCLNGSLAEREGLVRLPDPEATP